MNAPHPASGHPLPASRGEGPHNRGTARRGWAKQRTGPCPAASRGEGPRARLVVAALLVILAVAFRLIPHPWNFTPVGGVALFSGAAFDRRRFSFAVPLAAMLLSDWIAGTFHVLSPVVYACFAISVVIGIVLRAHRSSPVAVGAGALIGATIFYFVTNFAMWTISTVYPRTFAGLVACYVAGLPYFGRTLAGDLIWSAVLFTTFVMLERRVSALAPA